MTPMPPSVLRASAALALAAGALAPALSAQTVRGAVVDTARGAPVAGAVVRLVPAAGDAADSAASGSVVLTDERGRFVLRAPAPGRWVVEAKRIGVRPARSPALDLAAGETREVTLGVSPVTARLSAVRVLGDAQCAERVASAKETATLWEEVRAALTATRITRDAGPPVSLTRWARRVNPRSGAVLAEQRNMTGAGANRFTSVPAEQLSALGWIVRQADGSHLYHGPDVTVLLSTTFVRDHCFRPIVADTVRDMVGLAFEPAAHRKLPDITGVLWLDAATHELRRVDYRYTRLPHDVRYDQAGGSMEFERMPSGAWIVRRWVIRMPEVALGRENRSAGGYPGDIPRHVVVSVLEEGGEAVLVAAAAAAAAAGVAPRDAAPAIVGTVWDSAAAGPLVGARVWIEGTPYAATTDEEGGYRLLLHHPGAYTVTLRHPRLDSLGVARPRASVTVGPGEARRDLALPSAAAAAAALCPAQPPGAAVVHGRVAFVGAAPPDAPALEVKWLERALVQGQYAFRPTSGGGTVPLAGAERRYVLCGVPAGKRVRALLSVGGATTDLDLHVAPGQIVWRDVVLQGRR